MPAFRLTLLATPVLLALAACATMPEDEAPEPAHTLETCRGIEPVGARLACEEDLKRRGPRAMGG
jgi:hypothetical protein